MDTLFRHGINKCIAYAAIGNIAIINLMVLLYQMVDTLGMRYLILGYLVFSIVFICFTTFAMFVNTLASLKDNQEHLMAFFLSIFHGAQLYITLTYFI